MVPELHEDQDAADGDAMEEDAADADARRKAMQKAREEAELRKRSQVESAGITILLPCVSFTASAAHFVLIAAQHPGNTLECMSHSRGSCVAEMR